MGGLHNLGLHESSILHIPGSMSVIQKKGRMSISTFVVYVSTIS